MASTTVKVSSALSIVILLCAVYYKQKYEDEMRKRLESTLSGLLVAENRGKAIPNKRIAVGFGSCLDLLVDSSIIFNSPPPSEAHHYGSISNEKELFEVYSYFFNHGAAGERYVNNATLFAQLVDKASKLKNAKWALGGNAAVMATRFANEGAEVLLGAHLGSKTKSWLPEHIQVPEADSSNDDDIHLIFEYVTGNVWGKFQAPRANRFIIHNDQNNPLVASVETFQKSLAKFKPDLVVVSGLQMMDNYPFKAGERLARLKKIKEMIMQLESSVQTHFEMASFSDSALFMELIEQIIPYSDSLGMNEQELPNLRSGLLYGNLSLISPSHPRIASVLDQMRDVFRLLRNIKESSGKRKVTRLHVHTLAYQAIMVQKDSGWKNTMSATAKASLTANRHTCGSNKVSTDKAKLIMDDSFATSAIEMEAERIPYDTTQPVSCWSENDVEICIAPVLVCTEVRQTAGGGDNISSSALLPQV